MQHETECLLMKSIWKYSVRIHERVILRDNIEQQIRN